MYTCFCWDICSSSSTENCYWRKLKLTMNSVKFQQSKISNGSVVYHGSWSTFPLFSFTETAKRMFSLHGFFWHKGLTQSSCFFFDCKVLHMVLPLNRALCTVYVCIWNTNNMQVEQLLCCPHCNSIVNLSHEIIMKKQNSCFTCNSYNYTSSGYLWASSFCLKGVLWFGFRGKMLHPKVLQVG